MAFMPASKNLIGGSAIARSCIVFTGLLERLRVDEFVLVLLTPGRRIKSSAS